MNEYKIDLDHIDPVKFFGVNNVIFNDIKSAFPDLKLVLRGNELKVSGNEEKVDNFRKRFNSLLAYFEKFGNMNSNAFEEILTNGNTNYGGKDNPEEHIILYSKDGQAIKPRSPNQLSMIQAVAKNDLVFAIGPAGTGKTYVGMALAVKALKEKQVKRIILTRPAVEAGENLGYLPGDLNEKLSPYLQPLYDALHSMLPPEKLHRYTENGVIQIAPLAYMRGRTLDNAFVILDEAQNATSNQMKMFLTRMGGNAKFIVTGDITQIDLPKNQQSGLKVVAQLFKDIKDISFIYFDEKDVVRHHLVKSILSAYAKNE